MKLSLPGPKGLPLLGNLHQIKLEKLHLHMLEWAERFGDVYQLHIGPRPFVVVSDVEALHEMLRARPGSFRRMRPMEEILAELGANGVFSAEGEDWKRHRELTLPAFHTRNLKPFFSTIFRMTERLERRLSKDCAATPDVEVQKLFKRYTVDVTTSLAFAHDSCTLERDDDVLQSHLETIFPAVARRLNSPIPYWRVVKLPSDRRVDEALAAIRRFCESLIEETEKRLTQDPALRAEPTNFIESLLAASAPGVNKLSHEEVLGNVMTILIAGEDTTANALAWLVKHLIDTPELQERIRAEAEAVSPDRVVIDDVETVGRLAYTEAVALESMRLKPVAPFLFLEAVHATEVAGHRLPAGTAIAALTAQGARQSTRFDDPERFIPERWLPEFKGKFKRHDVKAFMPFGAGARFCPGRSLAMLEIKSVLSMLCRRFRLSPAEGGGGLDERFTFVAVPLGFRARIVPR